MTNQDPAMAERAAVVKWLRAQSEKGGEIAIQAEKGTTRRAVYGGGCFALFRAADAIEAGQHKEMGDE